MSQMANRKLSCAMLYRWFKCKLKPPKNNSDQPIERLAGEQIAQLLFIKVATPTLIQVTSLAKTERGEYGFGAHTN